MTFKKCTVVAHNHSKLIHRGLVRRSGSVASKEHWPFWSSWRYPCEIRRPPFSTRTQWSCGSLLGHQVSPNLDLAALWCEDKDSIRLWSLRISIRTLMKQSGFTLTKRLYEMISDMYLQKGTTSYLMSFDCRWHRICSFSICNSLSNGCGVMFVILGNHPCFPLCHLFNT